jgi:hypothetical protein
MSSVDLMAANLAFKRALGASDMGYLSHLGADVSSQDGF